uniref:CCHC-type domain-containing protein n=1 Tax=Fagus sylvatica TaxID=28930 RepID=A0A2N9HX55_FAGSY
MVSEPLMADSPTSNGPQPPSSPQVSFTTDVAVKYVKLDVYQARQLELHGVLTTGVNPSFLSWKKRDKALLTLIYSTLSPPVLSMVVGLHSAQEVWSTLETRFTSTARANVLNLKLELQSVKKGSDSISAYMQRVKTARDKLSAVEELSINESSELNSSLAMFVSNTNRQTNGSSNYNRGRGRNHYSRGGRGNGRSGHFYPQNQFTQNHSPGSQGQNQSGFHGQTTSSYNKPEHNRPTCQICGKLGHYAIDCYHRMDFAYQGKNPPTKLAAMANASNLNMTQGTGETWLTDSGASDHITADLNNLNQPTPFKGPEQVSVGNGQNLPIQNIGNTQLHTKLSLFKLRNVLHVPRIASNLLLPPLILTLIVPTLAFIHHLTCPHTPQQNGVAERKHRHLIQITLALLSQSGLSLSHWSYAIATACHLINKLPTPLLNMSSPWEQLHHATPLPQKAIYAKTLLPKGSTPRDMWCSMKLSFQLVKPQPKILHLTLNPIPQNIGLHIFSLPIPALLYPAVTAPHHQYFCPKPQFPLLSFDPSSYSPNTQSPASILCSNPQSQYPILQSPLSQYPLCRNTISVPNSAETPTPVPISAVSPLPVPNSAETSIPAPNFAVPPVLLPHSAETTQFCSNNLFCSTSSTFPTPSTCPEYSSYANQIQTWNLVLGSSTPASQHCKLDVSNAFLHGILKEEVYMSQPQGYISAQHPDYVCRLHKSIYGLKQAPRAWFERFTGQLLQFGFTASAADSSLFIYRSKTIIAYLLLYVDDIVLTSNTPTFLDTLIQHLSSIFELKDLGPLHYFLGIQCIRCVSIWLPLPPFILLQLRESSDTSRALSIWVFPFRPGPLKLSAFTDADWAGDPDDRRSTSGLLVYLGPNPITWSAKKQLTVSRSSTESEYRALALASAEVCWLRTLLKDLGVFISEAPILWCDNISALAIASNPVFHARTKHIEVDFHFVREACSSQGSRSQVCFYTRSTC